MKWRPVWIVSLLAALFCSVIVFRRMDALQFHGLRVMSLERLEQMTENREQMSAPARVTDLVTADGERIPYDAKNNTFYMSQSVEKDDYAGVFAAAGEDCGVYLQADAVLYDKAAAIAEGHRFHLWFVTQEAYAVSDLVFTGLPMISISSERGRLSAHYEKGTVIVQNPNDREVITMSVKASDMKVKKNDNAGTITFQLYKKGYREERKLGLLGLGKRTSWKLYPVHDEDGAFVRELLSAYVWNCVCGKEKLQRNMEYAEVIVDGEYKGLYYLAPKVGKGYLDLGEDDRVYKMEGRTEDGTLLCETVGDRDTDENRAAAWQYAELWEEDGGDLTAIDSENYINYHIWMQTVCGVQNGAEDHYLIAYQSGGAYRYDRMPGRSKFIFGNYPAEIGWQSLQAADAVMEDEAYERLAEAQGASFSRAVADRWKQLRDGELDTEMLTWYVSQREKELMASGYCNHSENMGGGVNEASLSLRHFIRRRMTFLDGYFLQAQ